jgi:hypothetical protein
MSSGNQRVSIANLPLFHIAIPRHPDPIDEALLVPHPEDAPLGYGSRVAYRLPDDTYTRPAQFGSICAESEMVGTVRVLLRRPQRQWAPTRVGRPQGLAPRPIREYERIPVLISARLPALFFEALRITHRFTRSRDFHIRKMFQVPKSHVPYLESWSHGGEPKWLPIQMRPIPPPQESGSGDEEAESEDE